jgi:serine protease inhibitor
VAQLSSFTMNMDRPFLYAIRDDVTGELLFIGALMNPS